MQIPPKTLRTLATELVADLAADIDLPTTDHDALATSLVRQWITNDGNATLFAYDRQLDLTVERSPLGKPTVRIAPGANTWIRLAMKDWKIDDDALTDIFDQLNHGQSAEASNDQHERIRLWINPKTHAFGLEVLESKTRFDGKADLARPARTLIERELGQHLDDEALEALATSLVSQWNQFDGYACIFVKNEVVRFILESQPDDGCRIDIQRHPSGIDQWFRKHGVAEHEIPGVIARLNLNHSLTFRDHHDTQSRVWHDPKMMRLRVSQAGSAPVFCPQCKAVLPSMDDKKRDHRCVHCGLHVAVEMRHGANQ